MSSDSIFNVSLMLLLGVLIFTLKFLMVGVVGSLSFIVSVSVWKENYLNLYLKHTSPIFLFLLKSGTGFFAFSIRGSSLNNFPSLF